MIGYRVFGVLLIVGALVGLSPIGKANATYFSQSGVVCRPGPSQPSDFYYDYEGIWNVVSASRTVYCASPVPSSFVGSELRVTAYDATSTAATACQGVAMTASGATYTTTLRYTSGANGQYTTPVNSYIGPSLIYWVNGLPGLTDAASVVFTCTLAGNGHRIRSVGVYTSSP